MSKGLLSKKVVFLLTLIAFVLLYASVTFNISFFGYVGVVAYVFIALSQAIQVNSAKK